MRGDNRRGGEKRGERGGDEERLSGVIILLFSGLSVHRCFFFISCSPYFPTEYGVVSICINFLYLSAGLYHCLSVHRVCIYICVCVGVSHCISPPPPYDIFSIRSVSPCLWLIIYKSVCLSVSVCLTAQLSFCLYLCGFLSFSVCLSVYL